MPGLIDAHMHAYCSDVIDAEGRGDRREPYRTAHAVRMLGHALDCGFTTVRDIGGGDYSLARAIADGLVRAPRFFYAGKVLSMTGGHGDFRPLEQKSHRPRVVLVRHRQLGVPRGRRRRCVHPGGPRRAAPGRALHQDHGLGRRRVADRSDLDEPVPRGRDPRDRQRMRRAADLCRRALPSGERGPALRRIRRALDRARHADRRRHRALRRRNAARTSCRRWSSSSCWSRWADSSAFRL